MLAAAALLCPVQGRAGELLLHALQRPHPHLLRLLADPPDSAGLRHTNRWSQLAATVSAAHGCGNTAEGVQRWQEHDIHKYEYMYMFI